MAVIEVALGDITEQAVDAIVTAADDSLLGGGADGAVHRATDPRLAQAGGAIGPVRPRQRHGHPAFDLAPVRHVIYTVGPVWEGGSYGEPDLLASCYRRSLGVRSIAFPAVATDLYDFPTAQPARIARESLTATPTAVELIRLVAFDEETYEALSGGSSRSGPRYRISMRGGRTRMTTSSPGRGGRLEITRRTNM
ncbi:macro domain-containing protein [Kutzneria sp. NPDC051319]|uniref:macro domain-containing protein n=1 Tax=Kutzneria sp. NPDC051319 TaxID=3155047 RepID=UPI00343FE2F9